MHTIHEILQDVKDEKMSLAAAELLLKCMGAKDPNVVYTNDSKRILNEIPMQEL